MSKLEKNLLIILSLLSVLTKGLFILTLLSFIIPNKKFKNKYQNLLTVFSVIILQIVLSSHSHILTANGADINFRKSLLFNYPLFVIKLFINTIINKTTFYIQSSIFRLGWLEIEPNPIAIISLFISFLISTTLESHKVKKSDKFISALIMFIFILLSILLYFLTFTPLSDNIILGIQGRYFIPLYPLFALLLLNVFNKKISVHKRLIIPIIILVSITNLIYALFLISNNY